MEARDLFKTDRLYIGRGIDIFPSPADCEEINRGLVCTIHAEVEEVPEVGLEMLRVPGST